MEKKKGMSLIKYIDIGLIINYVESVTDCLIDFYVSEFGNDASISYLKRKQIMMEREIVKRCEDNIKGMNYEFIFYYNKENETRCLITGNFSEYNMYDVCVSNRKMSLNDIEFEMEYDFLLKTYGLVKEKHQIS